MKTIAIATKDGIIALGEMIGNQLPTVKTANFDASVKLANETAAVNALADNLEAVDELIAILPTSVAIKANMVVKAVNTVRKHQLATDANGIVDSVIAGINLLNGEQTGKGLSFALGTDLVPALTRLASLLLSGKQLRRVINKQSLYRIRLFEAKKGTAATVKSGDKVTFVTNQNGYGATTASGLYTNEFSLLPKCEHELEVRETARGREIYALRMIKTANGYVTVSDAFAAFRKGTLDLGDNESGVNLMNQVGLNWLTAAKLPRPQLMDLQAAQAAAGI